MEFASFIFCLLKFIGILDETKFGLTFCIIHSFDFYQYLHPETLNYSSADMARALQWVPMNFFPKIPEIDLRRFSLQFSLGIHEKLEKFQNISIEDLSENFQYLEKRFQCDNAVYRNKCRNNEAFSRYASYH
jgi:hypothetical protein